MRLIGTLVHVALRYPLGHPATAPLLGSRILTQELRLEYGWLDQDVTIRRHESMRARAFIVADRNGRLADYYR